MARAMLAAVSALRNFQTKMDVVANNIANLNTTAFKASRVTFQELVNQISSLGRNATATLGGANPVQIGLGVGLGSTDQIFTQGTLEATGRPSDMAIQGDGLFVFEGPDGNLYGRDGGATLDANGTLVNSVTGYRILGWMVDATGAIDTSGPLTQIDIPVGAALTTQSTVNAVFGGNVDSRLASASTVTSDFGIYDSLGNLHTLTMTFTKTVSPNEWTWQVTTTDPDLTIAPAAPTTVTFLADGTYDPANPAASLTITYAAAEAQPTSPQTVTLDLSDVTQMASERALSMVNQDGNDPGNLTGFSVTSTGEVIGTYNNGMEQAIGQVALARFANPGGLQRMGQNLFGVAPNAGNPSIGVAGTEGRGLIQSGYVEQSNVDLAQQFTDMISAQRGFQANSRIISASDQMLQELVNLVR